MSNQNSSIKTKKQPFSLSLAMKITRITSSNRTKDIKIWGFVVVQDEKRLITGSSDSELRVWSMNYGDEVEEDVEVQGKKRKTSKSASNENDSSDGEEEMGPITCDFVGSLMRQSTDRVATLVADSTGRYFSCHGIDSILEVYRISNQEEISKTLRKRSKKLKKKQREKPEAEQVNEDEITVHQTVEDEFHKVQAFKMKSKLRSCDSHLEPSGELKVVLLHNNNSLSVCKISVNQSNPECSNIAAVIQAGHRSDTRTVAFSSDASCVLTGSGESVKIWNRFTQKCIRTLESDYALSSIFVPGDRHVIVGTKTGKLELFDIAAGVLLEVIDAHEGAVWGLAMSPDQKGFVSGSADHDVKFWEFELVDDPSFSSSSKRLSMAHVRTLKMQEDVLGVKYSPDQRLLAVSLLDCTVKVFFSDTLKFFLSLYGHKLPALCMDISLDSTLLITGSADKNIKIWGLDFGDCHKSIFAHDDSIMDVKFVSKTHYFFSVSKDKTLKYWDADKYENIMTLQGHQAEIWCLAVSSGGEFVVTGSHDKSIRLWERTEELLVIEEEREQEREEAYEQSLAEGGEPVIPGETDAEAGFAGKKTLETMKGAERIMEAMELCKEEEEKLTEYQAAREASGKKIEPPPAHPILAAYGNVTPLRYVLDVLKKVRSSELEESLLVLPFSYVMDLLKLINRWLQNSWEIELSSRCLFFLLRVHHNQIVSNQVLLDTIDELRKNTKTQIGEMKDQVGFNLAGLQFIQREMEAKSFVFFADASEKLNKRKKKKTLLTFR